MPTPKCPYFGTCGGCTAQHIDYTRQLESKASKLAKVVGISDIKTFSGSEYGYRNRIDLLFHGSGLGLRKGGEWQKVIDVKECLISSPAVNSLIKEVRDYFKDVDVFNITSHSGTFRYAVIRASRHTPSISFVLNSQSSRLKEAAEKIKEFAEKTTAANIIVTYVPPETDVSISDDFYTVKGEPFLKETFLGCSFKYSCQAFFQNNTEMAEMMHEYCHKLLSAYDTSSSELLDLYGGVGTFGIINRRLFRKVTIVEEDKNSIESAMENIWMNNADNVEAVHLDASRLKKLGLSSPLFVIADPPRSGMEREVIAELNKLAPKIIIYVSCNMQHLAKDLKKFRKYSVKSAALFDFFPQTPHAEAVVELVRIQ